MKKISFFLLAFLLLAGCASSKNADSSAENAPSNVYIDPGLSDRYPSKDYIVKTFDLSGDLQIDLWKVYILEQEHSDVAQKNLRLIRKEVDNNADGKVDQWMIYDIREKLEREEIDTHFTGRIDRILYYKDGILERVETYSLDNNQIPTEGSAESIDVTPNIIKTYRNGAVSKMEKDEDGDGRVDVWEIYNSKGEIVQIGKDEDSDGTVDGWDHF